ncbi:small nucleolar ribonucleoprotein complex subunit Utp14, putatrive [Babesia caballi]|uniref:Small nucleolar ribonucleoprotein complex subunit Utp14, putatrive n=1 Tax=Babesia caballi TaxID=5871 RepID=A0AAV4LMU6_BABCB|nr:small nucleolar ribonucleoprotein complex subunit Utp14, putatrive [Babesia caballi]
MRRRQGTIKAVVQRTEKSGVGMLYGGGGASQLSKPTERGLDHFRGLVAVEMICNISMPNHKVLKVGTTPSAVEPLRLPPALIPGLLTLPIQVRQPVVIERQAAEEDLGNLAIVSTTVPSLSRLRNQHVLSPLRDAFDEEGCWIGSGFCGVKCIARFFNLIN